ncbi:YkgJ family cysteine cluster protein [Dissulfurirhabdus thermomarina]|uniref:YkgJ family cysteine cluster protein n=1 Tax=Dissulfurirhabdus thermomarina TaxID=1765737 RepID=A0A6N9TTW9_DISTH|nr:YkgJ family cysteine cluster protein [Dissulfurirhabdus thermomarina]NDY43184.1 YkgJ family cysteine cluster protein [Dissulfurirhabdus thermomarina]NMX22852.1 YkgJ family cysteine cluster protein [Dissulfurirhabdus thermomarina]
MSPEPEAYIDDSRRLTDDDTFVFACHPGCECFTRCCHDLSLVLMPYDILRLKRRLGLSSGEFLRRYTSVHVGQGSGLPVVTLKMEGADLRCPFLDPGSGCTVYEDRPSACRTYPLARMARRSKEMEGVEEFYFVVREPDCLGFREDRRWSVREWKENEGLGPYNAMNDAFGELLQAKTEVGVGAMDADQIEIFYLGCYDVDGFRASYLEGPSLDRYLEPPEVLEEIARDEEALLRHGMRWVKKKLFQGGCAACGAACGRGAPDDPDGVTPPGR